MLRRFYQTIHEWITRVPIERQCDPVLGELVIEESWWECTVSVKAGTDSTRCGWSL